MSGKPGMKSALLRILPSRFWPGFPWDVNLSSKLGRALRATLQELFEHLGGEQSLSGFERRLCHRAVFIERRLLDHETATLASQAPLLTEGEYIAAVNTLSSLYQRLGLKARVRIQPTVAAYLASKGAA